MVDFVVFGLLLNLMILGIASNLNDSMILLLTWVKIPAEVVGGQGSGVRLLVVLTWSSDTHWGTIVCPGTCDPHTHYPIQMQSYAVLLTLLGQPGCQAVQCCMDSTAAGSPQTACGTRGVYGQPPAQLCLYLIAQQAGPRPTSSLLESWADGEAAFCWKTV